MPDYQNSVIYKIWNPDIPEQAYYGSTAHKYPRKRYSRAKCYERENPERRFGKIFTTDNHRFEIIEKYPCSCRKHLNMREQYYIKNYPDAINKNWAYGQKCKVNKYVLFFDI
jgi:hypothetical protein